MSRLLKNLLFWALKKNWVELSLLVSSFLNLHLLSSLNTTFKTLNLCWSLLTGGHLSEVALSYYKTEIESSKLLSLYSSGCFSKDQLEKYLC